MFVKYDSNHPFRSHFLLLTQQQNQMCPQAVCVCVTFERSFAVMPLVVATAWPHIDFIGYWSNMAMWWMSACLDGMNCWFVTVTLLRNCYAGCTYTEHTHLHTVLLFIGILGPPTFLLRRLIVAGCVALHEGKTQQLLSLQAVPEHAQSLGN